MKPFFFLLLITSCALQTKYPSHWWTEDSPKDSVVLSDQNELGQLDPLAATPFWLHGKRYASVESFWQMMKFPEDGQDPRKVWKLPYTREQVASMSGKEARVAGELADTKMRQDGIDWVSYQGQRMQYCSKKPGLHYRLIKLAMEKKLRYNPQLRRLLLGTWELELKADQETGACPAPEWQYHQLWMEIRQELKRSLWPARNMLPF